MGSWEKCWIVGFRFKEIFILGKRIEKFWILYIKMCIMNVRYKKIIIIK